MANKWFGKIGYAETVETRPGVWEEVITEREYYGDISSFSRRLQSTSQVNDNIDISNAISIVADPYANENFHSMRYIELMGCKWKITSVDIRYPRLELTVGGIYNGE